MLSTHRTRITGLSSLLRWVQSAKATTASVSTGLATRWAMPQRRPSTEKVERGGSAIRRAPWS